MKYQVREATLADADTLARHRAGMFTDMGVPVDPAMIAEFRRWLNEMMPAGTYRAWVVESTTGEVISGGGITIIPWPPGPRSLGGRVAFVYNVYTEPAFRKQGHGRAIMEAIHTWCRAAGIWSVALNASQFGQALYEAMGYRVTDSPMMYVALNQLE